MNTLRFKAHRDLDLVKAGDDIAITGWEQAEIEIVLDGERDECQAETAQDTLLVRSQTALAIRVPRDTSVHVGQADGDLILRNLGGNLTVDAAHGDLTIRNCLAAVTVHNAQGSLVAEQLAGDLEVDNAHGDVHVQDVRAVHLDRAHASLYAHGVAGDLELGVVQEDIQVRDVGGSVSLKRGQGDFRGQELRGGMALGPIEGDLLLRTDVSPACGYHARTQGSITAWFPAETNARFALTARGRISAGLPHIESQGLGRVEGRAGAGQATVDLDAGGDLFVQVSGQQGDEIDAWATMDSISAQIESEIAQHLDGLHVDARTQQEIDRALLTAEKELAKAQQRIEQERIRAQERAERAQERAAQAARRAQEKLARRSRRWGASGKVGPSLFGPPLPPHPPRAQNRGPSSQEQLAVLKMLQENKITVEEAEALLAALQD